MTHHKLWKFSLIVLIIFTWLYTNFSVEFSFQPFLQKFSQVKEIQAASLGPSYASTAVENTSIGTISWSNYNYATSTDNSKASVVLTKNSGISYYIKATDFGFSLPLNARIDGITVEWEKSDNLDGGLGETRDYAVRIVQEDTIGSTDQSNANNWTTTDTFVSYGSTSYLWGLSWTAANINNSTFGAAISCRNTKISGGGAATTAYIDSVRITITYTLPTMTVGTTGSQTSNLSIPSTNSYVGGAFTLVTDINTATATQIIITDTGTVNANSNLSNVNIYYETAGTCTYDANETLFGTGASFNVSEKVTITGTMSVGTSQVCVYVVLDVGAGASASQTIEIEITNPSTEVTITNGSVTPVSVVAISETSTLIAPTVSCNASNGSTDFGALTNLIITTASPNITITSSCTYAGGCTITIKDQGNTSSPGLYRSVAPVHLINSSDATLSAGTEGYGIQATTTGSLIINSKYIKTDNDVGGLTTTDTNLASSSATYSNQTIVITHKAAISNSTTAGNYSDTITYSCNGN
ncbi:MAG: hypothetical protein WC306_00805 [Candidatus Paceibacterota bacterium]|jgi:hypothetical protein